MSKKKFWHLEWIVKKEIAYRFFNEESPKAQILFHQRAMNKKRGGFSDLELLKLEKIREEFINELYDCEIN